MRKKSGSGSAAYFTDSAQSADVDAFFDIYSYKQTRLMQSVKGVKGKLRVGLVFQLNTCERLPLWAAFFESLNCEVVLWQTPQGGLNVDGSAALKNVCYPLKLVVGAAESLLESGVDCIFMPCESFAADERYFINAHECYAAGYFPEIIRVISDGLTDDNFIAPYLDVSDRVGTAKKLYNALNKYGIKRRAVKKALDKGYAELVKYHSELQCAAEGILSRAERAGRRVIVLACRQCNFAAVTRHRITERLTGLGFAVLSDDVAAEKFYGINGQNYCARLYGAAEYVCRNAHANFLHVISRGCGVDEAVSDGVRAILKKSGKPYFRFTLDERFNIEALSQKLLSEDGFSYDELII